MDDLTLVQRFSVWLLPVLFAITLHEVAHGWVASRLGDNTAKSLGRLSLNPLRHIDPVGTILVPGLLLAFGGFIFGWAKPVPVDWGRLRHPRRDMALVAVAGPGANLIMALGWAILLRLAAELPESLDYVALPLGLMGKAGVAINSVLMVLNLLPIPPLDGSRVVSTLLPLRAAIQYSRIEPYGFWILLILIYTDILGRIMVGPLLLVQHLIYTVVGLAGGA
ncbi:site-2 protease family protein [Methylococcus mesophilus]|uniref:site-2 protease family protein n=1 Tax=Methylococcus mesophilus TaxID=2993564 RepID=UPI00224A4967|nr:site-2 protease family protein [Methylococcus mesophilus]UZR28882.1 site-2 protease family protein [Methylococcus mesophilus]